MIYECKYFTVSEIIRTYMQRYLDTINRLFRYGMVSLGQYVVDCCLTTGSKVFNSTFGHRNSSHEYERIRNQGQRRKLLNFEELRMQDNDLYCPKREYPKDLCKDSSNNSATQFSSKRKEVRTIDENYECFCGTYSKDVIKKWLKKRILHTKIRVDPVFTLELKIPSTDDSHTQKRAACQEIFYRKRHYKAFFPSTLFCTCGYITTEKIWKKKRGILQLYF